ncbi:hypothetical protein EDD15DRAFT_2367950 [Pisolithus albus]|nr:hypothetical protein EDD15DRAFT_2367950 [Pisolithus albus]
MDSQGSSVDPRPAQKRPPDDGWTQGHHTPKSSKAEVTSLAPQVDKSIVSEEQTAQKSQQRLLSVIMQRMWGQPPQTSVPTPGLPNVASASSAYASPGQSRESTPGNERTPPISRERTPARNVRRSSTASSIGTIGPRTTVRPPTTIQEILDTQLNTRTVGDKGKQRATESNSNTELPQGEFRVPGLALPPWPSVSEPPVPPPQLLTALQNMQAWPQFPDPSSNVPGASLGPSAPVPDTTSINVQGSGPSPNDGCAVNEVVAPLLSYFSSGMDNMLNSIQKSQATSYETIMKEIGTIHEQLKISNPASKNQPGFALGESSNSHCRVRKQTAKRHHFVAANPELQVTSQDEQEHSAFLRCIRVHTLALLKIRGYKYLRNAKCTLSQQQVDEYEQGLPGCLQITATDFMVDCLHNRDSPFNQDAATVFAEDFLEKITRHSWYASAQIPEHYRNHETIRTAFIAHLAYVKSRYKEVVTAVDEDPDKAKQAVNARLQKSSRGSRKLLKMRLDAMADHPTLRRHLPLIKDLGTQAMSSDESEDEVRRTISYPRVYPAWRSEQPATLLWQADDVAAANATVSIGKRKKAGTQLRLRPHSGKVNTKAAAPQTSP